MQPTLLILAAGMASRYGSMKQTEGFGPGGETIMDYSIYDAIRAGFGKVVFIIREELKADLIEDNSIWKDVIIYDPNNGDMPVNNNEDIITHLRETHPIMPKKYYNDIIHSTLYGSILLAKNQ